MLLRAVEDRGLMGTLNGNIAIGWLVVEDLAMVLVLVILPAIAGSLGGQGGDETRSFAVTLALTLGRVALFVVLMLGVGRKLLPRFLWAISGSGSRELFTLAVVALGIGIAYGAAVVFGVSFALGAFFAGMVLRESSLSHRAAEESLPLREAFSVLFFVAVGMLFDPHVLIDEPLRLLMVIAIVMIGKSVAAALIILPFRYPLNTSLTVSASLAQIGEFSFILAALGVSLGILPKEGQSLILSGSIISIALNPMVFHAIEPIQRFLRHHSEAARRVEERDDPLAHLPPEVTPEHMTGHVVLVGFGRVGKRIGEALRGEKITFVVVEQNRETVERLRSAGHFAVSGDAADPAVLIQAHVARAKTLIIATPDAPRTRAMLDTARRLNPKIETVVRTHSDAEAELLRRDKVDGVFMGEHELARGMIRHVLAN